MIARRLWILVVLLAAPAAPCQEQDSVIAAIIEQGQEHSRVMAYLDHLVNRIGPRLTSSDRLTQAQEWAVEQFKGMGLEVKLEPWGTFPVGFNRGPWFGRVVEPAERTLTFGTPAWSPGTKGRQRGGVVAAPKEDATDQELMALEGSWVLEPPRRTEGFGRAWRRRLRELCARVGALGLISSTGGPLVRTSGDWRISWEEIDGMVVRIQMVKEDYEHIAGLLEQGEDVELEFDIRNWWRRGPIQLYNVVADLKGTERPEEFVIVGGHIDSWDGATGTTDNGTGTSTTLEAARILTAAGARPRRTIRFMLWSGEEQGLLGSRAWVQGHQDQLERISAVYVHDGGTNYLAGIGGTEHQVEDFRRIFAPVMDLDPEMPFKVREVDGLSSFGGSDHASFIRFGVPGFFWSQKGRAKYGYGWHTQNDTYDLAIPEYQRHSATVIAVGAYGTANLDHLLSREAMRHARGAIPTGRMLGVNIKRDSLEVTRVRQDSAAERAGVKVGDVLLELDGVKLKDRYVLRDTLNSGKPEKKLRVRRGGKTLVLEVSWPEAEKDA